MSAGFNAVATGSWENFLLIRLGGFHLIRLIGFRQIRSTDRLQPERKMFQPIAQVLEFVGDFGMATF